MKAKIADPPAPPSARCRALAIHVGCALLLIAMVAGLQYAQLRQRHARNEERTRVLAQTYGNALADAMEGFFRAGAPRAFGDHAGLREIGEGGGAGASSCVLQAMAGQVDGMDTLNVPDACGALRYGLVGGAREQIDRFTDVQRIPGQALSVVVGLDAEHALAGWWIEVWYTLAGTLLLAAIVAGGTVLLYRGRVRHLQMQDRMADSNRNLMVLSNTDGLTGLANRRHFDDVLAIEWRRAARDGHPLALLMLDIDLFKQYNDHYGHPGGDACLRLLAQVLQRDCKRAGDLAARYGGEEFVVICPATDRKDVLALASIIHRGLEMLALPHTSSPYGQVTVSIGAAVLMPGHRQPLEELIRRADQALYRAKRQGRNRTVMEENIRSALTLNAE